MNDNHQRHLLVTFGHIDHLLSEAERILAEAGSASPFNEYTQDSTPVQRKVIHDYIQRVRQAMGQAMTDLQLPRPAPVCGALWAARGHFGFASIAVAEIEPKRMRGYGALSDADGQAIDRVVAELNAALDRLTAYVDKGPATDLQARLQKLDQTRDEVPLLRALERVVTAHGLVEFRGALTLLLDRLENGAFEIGIFGRVSSGKSSLLNHLLGAEVLPVGVTPVTAIPTRVRHGAAPRAVIEFAEGKPLQVELSRLAEFTTEQQNPGNAKHVARIQVELPSARLRDGVTFVDTPGLGSLATSGAEETVAYLPRCDLGLVLVDAASTLTHEDLAVVQALYQAGAQAMVLASKADLLQPAERQQTLTYVQQQLTAQLGVRAPVSMISVVGSEGALCDQWFDRELKPLLETHREQAAASLKRKVGGLREAVVKTLEARRQSQSAGPTAQPRGNVAEAIAALRNADALLEAAENDAAKLVDDVAYAAPALIELAAAELAAQWRKRRLAPAESATACVAALRRALSGHTGKVVERLESLRQQLEQALATARPAIGSMVGVGEPLPRPSGLPVFDPTAALPELDLRRPGLLVLLGAPLLRRSARSQLQWQLGDSLSAALSDYRRRVRQWLQQMLGELRAAFHAHAGPLRAQLEPRESVAASGVTSASLEADLRILQQGND
jgi:GTP-binding protein EngB required for normal cell division